MPNRNIRVCGFHWGFIDVIHRTLARNFLMQTSQLLTLNYPTRPKDGLLTSSADCNANEALFIFFLGFFLSIWAREEFVYMDFPCISSSAVSSDLSNTMRKTVAAFSHRQDCLAVPNRCRSRPIAKSPLRRIRLYGLSAFRAFGR